MTVGELKELLSRQDDRSIVKIEIPLSELPKDGERDDIEEDFGRPVWPLDVVDGKRRDAVYDYGQPKFVLQVAEEE